MRVVPEYQTEAILYEAHVRDMTISEDSGVKNCKGKFIGLVESGTETVSGTKTSLNT